MCNTEVTVVGLSAEGNWLVTGRIQIWDGQFVIKCYGTKVTLDVADTVDGIRYPAGTKLTVDKNLDWIEVSSWD
jgi:hypothetical protein